ncbi:hypothetical protein AQUCO_00900421v1 [Aquilegia coerulea]|uniref:C2H2-type domain-containing protein n=1 Tax=Aquilegia coerulea TaxID=218851 RepID=A0A2G5EDI0_AQUCA|nr:hypothetical protein AQUCO_00900421v1 [Aquilegia coerulea]
MAEKLIVNREMEEIEDFEEEEEDELENQPQDWDDWDADEEDLDSDFLCLFCELKFNSIDSLFEHCSSNHFFDFQNIRKTLGLDFYDSFKLINYIRSQVAEHRCWSCGVACQSNKDLQSHLHKPDSLMKDMCLLWKDDKYLKPFMQDDSFLYSFGEDDDVQEDSSASFDKEELMKELTISDDIGSACFDDENMVDTVKSGSRAVNGNESKEASYSSNRSPTILMSTNNASDNGTKNGKDKHLQVSIAKVIAEKKKTVNENYFGAYGSFEIHREMISDKVRMDAYRGAILNNPSLMNCATVMDVGCGTGILSLFAAQAGASKVISVEASEKMAAVATKIAKDNGLLWDGNPNGSDGKSTGVVKIVQCMVEDLEKHIDIPPNSVDVLVSEWMGYCLLYETMLNSVLYARDRWLKPGGAILPDTATIFVAGFGRGGTSIPFWENVYGFNMSCIGKEVVENSAKLPIVDVVGSPDIITNSAVIQC